MKIFIIDILSVLTLLITLVIIFFRKKRISTPILIISVFTVIFFTIYCLFMFLEWKGFISEFEDIENLSGVILPILFILLFTSLKDYLNNEKIKNSEERLQLAVQGSKLGIWDWDLKTGKVSFNAQWAEMLGYEKSELKEHYITWENLVLKEDIADVKTILEVHVKGQTPYYESEFRMKSKSGSWRWILSKGMVMERDAEGNALRAAGTHLDITEKKQMQEEIQLKNEEYQTANEELNESLLRIREINQQLEKEKIKAEESDNLKSAFLANLSHEIRTPMNGILGFAELLRNSDLLPTVQEKYIDLIIKSGNRMLCLINDLIDISKIEAGQVDIRYKATEITEIVKHVYRLMQPNAENKRISLQLKIESSEKIHAMTDDVRLEQILTNLTFNALKFTYQGYIEIGFKHTHDTLIFWVKDSGIGIAEDKIDIIFERFRQADDRILKPEEGCGLGLSITKALVELMDGKIEVSSELHKGSLFKIELPLIKV
ncbi:MAG: PAS domain-containing protein [Bacteroidales bacterium]|nr:PAS domain-containing protein [Bacteroidales bacterium]